MGNDWIAGLMVIQVNLIMEKTLQESAVKELKGSVIGNE